MLNKAAGRGGATRSESCGRGKFMSTYEEFMVLLTMAILIVAILDYVKHHKK